MIVFTFKFGINLLRLTIICNLSQRRISLEVVISNLGESYKEVHSTPHMVHPGVVLKAPSLITTPYNGLPNKLLFYSWCDIPYRLINKVPPNTLSR